MKYKWTEEFKRVEEYKRTEYEMVNTKFSRRALIARVLLIGGGIAATHTSVGRALAEVNSRTQLVINGISKLWTVLPGNVRAIDFEGGTLTGSGGFDATGGTNASSIILANTNAIQGTYSADWPSIDAAYGLISSLDHGELYGYIYFRLDTIPVESIRFILGRSGSTVFGMSVLSNGVVTVEDGTSQVGTSSALQTGTIYRVGWHYQERYRQQRRARRVPGPGRCRFRQSVCQ